MEPHSALQVGNLNAAGFWVLRLIADVSFSIIVVLVGTALVWGSHGSLSSQRRQPGIRFPALGCLSGLVTFLGQAALDFVFQDLRRQEEIEAGCYLDDDDSSLCQSFPFEEQWEARDQIKASTVPSQIKTGDDGDSLPKPAIVVARNALRKAFVNTSNHFQQHRPHVLSKSRELAHLLKHHHHGSHRQLQHPVGSPTSVKSKSVHFSLTHIEFHHYDGSTSSSREFNEELPDLTPSDSVSSMTSSEHSIDSAASIGTGSILKKQLRYSQRRRPRKHFEGSTLT